MKSAKFWRCLLFFSSSLVLGCFLLRPFGSYHSENARRIAYFEQNADKYSLLLLGPSFVANQLLPVAIEQEFAREGFEMRAFNLGLQSYGGYELGEVIENLLQQDLSTVKLVVLDISLHTTRPPKGFRLSPEMVNSQTWRQYKNYLRDLNTTLLFDDWGEPFVQFSLNTLANVSGMGRGAGWIRTQMAVELPQKDPKVFTPHPSRKFLKGEPLAAFNRGVAALKQADPKRNCFNSPFLKAQPAYLKKWHDQFAARGIRVLFMISPVVFRAVCSPTWSDGTPMPALVFNDAAKYPELFDGSRRPDRDHLGSNMTISYSHLVGREAALWWRRQTEGTKP